MARPLRAFLTAVNEAHARADDSSGELGAALNDEWTVYASIPWRSSGIDREAYYHDLCEMERSRLRAAGAT